MNRTGYTLPELPFPPAHMPEWAEQLTKSTQAVLDQQYLHGPGGLDNFYDQAEGWIQTEGVKRGANRDYTPEPFKMAIPRRKAVTYDEAGNLHTEDLPVDPSIQMPALPPLPPEPKPGGGFVAPTPYGDPIYFMRSEVITRLEAILQRLPAK